MVAYRRVVFVVKRSAVQPGVYQEVVYVEPDVVFRTIVVVQVAVLVVVGEMEEVPGGMMVVSAEELLSRRSGEVVVRLGLV